MIGDYGPGYVNVMGFGAVGRSLATTGSINPGSNQLTVVGATGWSVGAGIAIAGVAGGGATLVTTITFINGDVFTLALPATLGSASARVSSDDTKAIQSAIDSLGAAGGTVYLPAGTYIIGAEGATTNQPLFVGSNIRLVGAGRGSTIIRLADDVRQIGPGTPPPTGCKFSFWNACLIINKGNVWWFSGNNGLPVPPRDDTIEIAHLTLDGNKDGQTSLYVRGNQTANVPDPTGLLAGPAGPGGTLVPDTYVACVTYTDVAGNETAATNSDSRTVAAPNNSFSLNLPPTPENATGLVLYIRNSGDPKDVCGDPLHPTYEDDFFRRQPLALPPGPDPKTLVINSLPIAPASELPPGLGIIHLGEASAPGIYLDQASNCHLHDLELRNFVVDGLGLSWTTHFILNSVRDSLFEGIWSHHNGRDGISITGLASSLRFLDCWFDDSGAEGCDIEPLPLVPKPLPPIQDISFLHCRFKGSFRPGAHGFAVAPNKHIPVDNLSLVHCEFDGNLLGFDARAAVGQLTNCSIVGCTFRNQLNTPCVVSAPGTGVIMGCNFDKNGLPTSNPPEWYYRPGAAEATQIVFEEFGNDPELKDSPFAWRVVANRIQMRPGSNSSAGIEIRGTRWRIEVIGNYWQANDPLAGNRYFLETTRGGLASTHLIHSNYGDETAQPVVLTAIFPAPALPPFFQIADLGGGTPVRLAGPTTFRRNVLVAGVTSLAVVLNPPLSATLRGSLYRLDYQVHVTLRWPSTGWWITGQTDTGFTINWNGVAPAGALLDWTVIV